MIENARRQAAIVLLAALVAAGCITFFDVNLGLDLTGGTQLVYEVDIQASVDNGWIEQPQDQAAVQDLMAQTVRVVAERVDPTGVTEAQVNQRGETGILVELPKMDDAQAEATKRRIENLGRLEMRLVARAGVPDVEDIVDIPAEKKRLEDWIATADHKQVLLDDPLKITLFNNAGETGPDSDAIRWYPRRIERKGEAWDASYAKPGYFKVPESVVAVYDEAHWNGGIVPADAPEYLLEYLPIMVKGEHFTGADLNASGVRRDVDDAGKPAINYRIVASRAGDYAEWSGSNIDHPSAIILNGYVRSAPSFQGKIHGYGQIHGGFTESEADELVKVLKTGSLRVRPTLSSQLTIGATLGERSIWLGQVSVGIGGALVFLFVLLYYRLSGIVACLGLALNIFLLLGVMSLVRATLTLPGIAGLVLTMGMAVDANILIYERIREELAKGKELLQGVKTGFERAIVTILDANITTFLAGVVLYNVGVGPIRGFAVTLMAGIVTSVFTAFFVSRLLFHFLLQRKILTGFHSANWFGNLRFEFLRYSRPAAVLSTIVIVAGLVVFAMAPYGVKMGLDFTGGANLQVVLQEPKSAQEIRELLAADTSFNEQYQSPAVSTAGDSVVAGRSRQFTVKIKLTDSQRDAIEAAKREAAKTGQTFVPPYEAHLRRIFAGMLVNEAASNASLTANPSSEATKFAQIDLHFSEPVVRETLRAAVAQHYGPSAAVTPLDGDPEAETARNFTVDYNVPADMASAALLFPELSEALSELTGPSGARVRLSNPIPEAEEIGGRMVGQLRNAAIGSMIIALFLIVMFIRIRFHEYKYGLAAVAALLHDILVPLGFVVAFHWLDLVDAELNLAMIAAFLTIVGYSINDTIVIFDRVRENLSDEARLGGHTAFRDLLNTSINQTLSRTILTSATTLCVLLVQFIVNYGSSTPLEGFSFALLIGLVSGTYSTIFVACPVVLWLRRREDVAVTASAAPPSPTRETA